MTAEIQLKAGTKKEPVWRVMTHHTGSFNLVID
ncbi:MAG: hypothetical protein ACJAZI_001433 [Cycloclasticus sp.]|jgi:hypothetical protein